MTSKVINNFQTISIRPQNELEEMVVENIKGLLATGKQPKISFNGQDIILEIKSVK